MRRWLLGFLLFFCLCLFLWARNDAPTIATATATTAATATGVRPFWRFLGVTSEANVKRAVVVQKTWGSRVKIEWFLEGETPAPKELGKVVKVTDDKYLRALQRGEGYKFMTFKMQWIWDHALNNGPTADWYVRHWEDNYVFVDALKRELSLYNPNEPILVGHRHYSKGNFAFPDGGGAWSVSEGAAKLWRAQGPKQCANGVLSEAKAREIFGPVSHEWAVCKDPKNPGLWCAEDIFLWYCLKQLGVRFVHYRGKSWPPVNLGLPSFDPTLKNSVLAKTESDDLLASSLDYYCVIHPVSPEMTHLVWRKESDILKRHKV